MTKTLENCLFISVDIYVFAKFIISLINFISSAFKRFICLF